MKEKFTIGVITPSWAGPSAFPEVFELGINRLKEVFDFNVKEFTSTRGSHEDIYNNPKLRAGDLMEAYLDDEVDLIITSIGGNDSIRILPYIDIDKIKHIKKPLMGFSDITTLLTFLNQNGMPTIHGPTIMAGFSEPIELTEEFIKHVKSFISKDWDSYTYSNYSKWTESEAKWKDENFFQFKKVFNENEGWKVLQGEGNFSGELYGGSLEIFEMMKGTPYMEDPSFLKGKVLILETSEEKPTASYITYALRSMGMRGVFDNISGLVFGRGKGYSQEEKEKINKVIKKIVSVEFNKKDLPIVTNLDFGHTQPQWILPFGINCEINLNDQSLTINGNPFKT